MSPERPVGEDDLQAFVDGRLPPARSETVAAFLEKNPQVRAEVDAYREQRGTLAERLRFKSEEPIPARLRVGAILAERQGSNRRRLMGAVAASLWLTLGAAIGWSAKEVLRPPFAATESSAMAREALSAHRVFAVEVVHPVEVRADQEAHLAQWLSKRLGRPLVIPNLGGLGMRLVGGRLLPADQNVAAQLMYEDDRGARVTVYVRSGESETTAFRFLREGELQTFYWLDRGFGYAVSGQTDRERLTQLAEAVFKALDGPGSGPTGSSL
jgi:anti-sigma factor RsiW